MNLVQQILAASTHTPPTHGEMMFADTLETYKKAFGRKALSIAAMSKKLDKSVSNTYKHFRMMAERRYIVKAGTVSGEKTTLWKWNFDRRET